jgi:hypothetical protein
MYSFVFRKLKPKIVHSYILEKAVQMLTSCVGLFRHPGLVNVIYRIPNNGYIHIPVGAAQKHNK